MIQELVLLCGEAINLADEYAGGESESVEEYTKQLNKLEQIVDSNKLKTIEYLFWLKDLIKSIKDEFASSEALCKLAEEAESICLK